MYIFYCKFLHVVKPRSPSPAWNSPSRILHIENLTRPFTILQLKELLQEDGPMVEGGFWTNRIKSHCIAIVSVCVCACVCVCVCVCVRDLFLLFYSIQAQIRP